MTITQDEINRIIHGVVDALAPMLQGGGNGASAAENTDESLILKCESKFSKSDKPYWNIGWERGNGKRIYGNIFSESFGAMVVEAFASSVPLKITWTANENPKYGADISAIEFADDRKPVQRKPAPAPVRSPAPAPHKPVEGDDIPF